MPVYFLHQTTMFPDPSEAEPIGLLAMGGDLSPERLISAYSRGIFPWYTRETPILWWSPEPRPILEPENLHVPKSLRRVINKKEFEISVDQDFESVIRHCSSSGKRDVDDGTWLLPEMIEAYIELHNRGVAHSVETWRDGQLAGGIYGIALGKAFFGESMFYNQPNASKVALVHLMTLLKKWGYHFMDCQQSSRHVSRFGAREVSRDDFQERLEKAMESGIQSSWPASAPSSEPSLS